VKSGLSEKKFSKIQCPLCGQRLGKVKPRTKKQLENDLRMHLLLSPKHYLLEEDKAKAHEKTKSIIADYSKSLEVKKS